ncbi:MAG: S-adenosylmethionine decarboxylase [Lentisphaerae bacterium]|nr:S-adenosylmethionine decarboxylase [Lentisphaerota bacterium]
MQVCEEPSVAVMDKVAFRDITGNVEEEPPSQILLDAITRRAWGVASSIDIYNCDPEIIRNADKIRQFVVELCDLIEMKRFQDTLVVNFGEDERVAGFSMVQLIETSLISAHFANLTNATYLDVFSCKPYEPKVVEKFAMEFFKGSHCIVHTALRL